MHALFLYLGLTLTGKRELINCTSGTLAVNRYDVISSYGYAPRGVTRTTRTPLKRTAAIWRVGVDGSTGVRWGMQEVLLCSGARGTNLAIGKLPSYFSVTSRGPLKRWHGVSFLLCTLVKGICCTTFQTLYFLFSF